MQRAASVDPTALLGTEWQKNATRFGSIPLYPAGEKTSFECMAADHDNLQELRSLATNMYLLKVINIVSAYVFFHALRIAIGLLRTRPRAVATWCCTLQAVSGVIYNIISLTGILPSGGSCRQLMWAGAAGMSISDLCISIVLLQKAYAVYNRRRWILAFIPLIVIAAPVITYIAWASPVILSPTCGCGFIYPAYFPWLRFGLYVPLDVGFSTVFIIIMHRQLRLFGSSAWKQLKKDGIQTIMCLLISHLICLILLAFALSGNAAGVTMGIDWAIAGLLLPAHIRTTQSTSVARPFSPISVR
ncbi:hypothetical protein THASP1DRAFT_32856 [Thamnocephalis sphaerospora]|uniref:G-protein coupled receptors family 1 profile domain-containing protein n=1 Tax=Thamnocephalis sphaerospora TaxID=78915 RepID=A0A4P9XI34_9FUNG|nr:hypothetical protein THASP1DRAFT_32856 [Thamnocephalis sphaerospora]|eukprot:RKP05307.1 hypothetical protein THASP1DRAFT_32856 [Thamnocephalis sphaerospora]